MRDLAVIASVIVLTLIVVGVFSVVTVLRTPHSQFGRAFTLFVNAAGLMVGTWFGISQIGFGARVIGAVVSLISAFSAIRVLRGMKN